jgi:16S rRNA (guanine966-N2)-methyltransferase
VRIISGKYKSRKIFSVPTREYSIRGGKSGLRPTTDQARETIFNVLSNRMDFEGIKCLDLFAGTGAFGFECISRGAARCDFVEQSGKYIQMIRRTSEELGCAGQTAMYKQDAMRFLNENLNYDLIFADPPYNFDEYQDLIKGILSKKSSVFVVEYEAPGNFLISINEYEVIDKKAGRANFKIFIRKEN